MTPYPCDRSKDCIEGNSNRLVKRIAALLHESSIVFWDFDGVIKDSVEVKAAAFEHLFLPYGNELAKKVRQHHEAHGGISRYDKIPIYLNWAGQPAGHNQVQHFCDRFSQLVLQAVIDSAWVPGVREYLQAHHSRQRFVLVTGTPEEEIRQVLRSLEMSHCFCEIHGAPKAKGVVVKDVLLRLQCLPEQALLVGDSETDFDAAAVNSVPFLLRRTSLNQDLQRRFRGPWFDRLDSSFSRGIQT